MKEEQVVLDYILSEVGKHLSEHVSFKRELLSLLKFIYASIDNDEPIIPFISKDRREVALSNIGNINNSLSENKLIVRGNIIIESDGSLTTNKISGIVYKEQDENYNSMLYTFYSQEYFNRFGVSLSKITFTDEYKLEEDVNSVPIKKYLFSTIYKPEFGYGNIMNLPQVYNNASLSHIYRNYKEPNLIYVDNISGMKENRRLLREEVKMIYLADLENPKELDFISPPVAVFDELTKEYKKIDIN